MPLDAVWTNPEHLTQPQDWMRSYRPEEPFDEQGALAPEIAALAPTGDCRMSANPHANGGVLQRDLPLPDVREYDLKVQKPGESMGEAARVLGGFLRDVMQQTRRSRCPARR